ncbi:unnamed protein product [Linum trigynum]|uniref:Uncharacterized protein n=1 Tax=Linum trigynum TaxID=586398 RepID=A0AAV2CH63_9ROSI
MGSLTSGYHNDAAVLRHHTAHVASMTPRPQSSTSTSLHHVLFLFGGDCVQKMKGDRWDIGIPRRLILL